MEDLKVRRLDKAYRGGKGKGKVDARTGLEGPERGGGGRGIALLFP
jgi:hypothetical protein